MRKMVVRFILLGVCLTAASIPAVPVGAESQIEKQEENPNALVDKKETEKENEEKSEEKTNEDVSDEKLLISEEQRQDEDKTSDEKADTETVGDGSESIIRAVRAALEQMKPDMDSQVMKDFLTASNLYDSMEESEKAELPTETREGISAVQGRIGEVIHTCEGVTATSKEWYVRTDVTDADNETEVFDAVREKYKGSAPEMIYHKNISYTDIRTETSYSQRGMISLTFPVPKDYDKLTNPQVLTISGGELTELSPERREEGFYLERARTVSNIIIVDLPIGLSGIEMDSSAAVNAGQKITLKVKPLPEGTTQEYTLKWSSSNTKVAKVSAKGVVTGVKQGTANITASVVGSPEINAVCKVKVVQGAHDLGNSLAQAMKETKSYMLSIDKNPTIGSEWFVIGLARGGMDLKSDYFKTYYNHFANYLEEQKGVLTTSVKYTEYSKAILTMTAIGKDARKVAGYNLFEPLADFDKVISQGINGPIWALIALNCNPDYTIPEVSGVSSQTTEQKLIDYILENETPGNGWALSGDSPDPDVTGMALQAFAPYYGKSGYDQVTAAVDRALEVLSTMQRATGGYYNMGVETSESCVQVLTGLCSLGINPKTDERFVKGGYWTAENLLTFHISGSGFMHVKPGSDNNGGGVAGEVNGMATEQGYYAMVAYQRFLGGQTSLYDMSDVQVKKGGKGDGQGTGMETPAPTPAPSNTKNPGGSGTSLKNTGTKSTTSGKTASTTKSTAKKASSGKSSKKSSKEKDSEGWDFDAEEFNEGGSEWNFDGEEEAAEVSVSKETGSQKKQSIPPLAMGVFGGIGGASLLEGGKYLYARIKKKKGQKQLHL